MTKIDGKTALLDDEINLTEEIKVRASRKIELGQKLLNGDTSNKDLYDEYAGLWSGLFQAQAKGLRVISSHYGVYNALKQADEKKIVKSIRLKADGKISVELIGDELFSGDILR